jgi:hypothetical protein
MMGGRRRRSGCSTTSAWKTMSQPTICCGSSMVCSIWARCASAIGVPPSIPL